MKRKRTNSSTESPSLRTTPNNVSLNGTSLAESPKTRTSNRTTKPTDGNTSDSRPLPHPQRNTPSAVASTFSVEIPKKRQLVSPQNKSRSRRDTTPPQSEPRVPTPPIRQVERKNVHRNRMLTPVKKNAKDLQMEIADGESEQIILARGMQRNQLDNEEDDYSEEDEDESEESEEEVEEDKTEREKVATTAAYDNFFQYG